MAVIKSSTYQVRGLEKYLKIGDAEIAKKYSLIDRLRLWHLRVYVRYTRLPNKQGWRCELWHRAGGEQPDLDLIAMITGSRLIAEMRWGSTSV